MVRSLTKHAMSCDICQKWVISGDFGNNPECREGREIRAEVVENNLKSWDNLTK